MAQDIKRSRATGVPNPAAVLLANDELVDAIVVRLSPASMAAYALASRAAYKRVQVPLAIIELDAQRPPAHQPMSFTTSLVLDSCSMPCGPQSTLISLQSLLPAMPGLLSLRARVPAFSQHRVCCLLDACSSLTALTHLALQDCCMPSSAAQALAALLLRLPCIQSLCLKDSYLSDHGLHVLRQAVLSCTELIALSLPQTGVSVRGLANLLRGLPQGRLRALNVAGVLSTRWHHGAQLRLLAPVKNAQLEWLWPAAQGLETLHAHGYMISSDMLSPLPTPHLRALHSDWEESFMENVRAPPPLTSLSRLTELSLRMYGVNTSVLEWLADALAALPGLAAICLEGNLEDYDWEVEAMVYVDALEDIHQALRALTGVTRLSMGKWCRDESWRRLCCNCVGSVVVHMRDLRCLDLWLLPVDCAALGRLQHLTALVLRQWDAGMDAAHKQGVLDALERMSALQALEFLEPEGCAPDVASLLPRLTGEVTRLTLGSSSIWPLKQEAAVAALPDSRLAPSYPAQATLQHLSLYLHIGNWIATTRVLQQCSALTSLNLDLLWTARAAVRERAESLTVVFQSMRKLRALTLVAAEKINSVLPYDLAGAVGKLKRLTRLRVRGDMAQPPEVRMFQTWRSALATMDTLQCLDLRGTFVGYHLMDSLATLPLLTSLRVRALGSAALCHLHRLTGLEVLRLEWQQLAARCVPAAFNGLSRLTRLSELGLCDIPLSHVSDALLELTQLQVLQMWECWQGVQEAAQEGVWVSVWPALKGMAELARLRLELSSRLYHQALEELHRHLPPWCSTDIRKVHEWLLV